MKTIWFKQTGVFYIPVHFMGFFTTLAAILFLVPVYSGIMRSHESVSNDLYQIFIYTTCIAFWWKWVAEKTSI